MNLSKIILIPFQIYNLNLNRNSKMIERQLEYSILPFFINYTTTPLPYPCQNSISSAPNYLSSHQIQRNRHGYKGSPFPRRVNKAVTLGK